MKQNRFKIAEKIIPSYFENSDKKVFTDIDILGILNQNRKLWNLPSSLTLDAFIDLLITNTMLKKHTIRFSNKKATRFAWGDVSAIRLATSLAKNAYLTHYTAMYLHNLTDQIPKTIYVNREQPKKMLTSTELSQDRIDIAFMKSPRISGNTANLLDYMVRIINGKYTNRLDVVEIMIQENNKVFVTGIERTLIDIAVRPFYSGGISEVLSAYKRAAEKVSINKLVTMLKELNYIYPYHQVVGFYLQKSGKYSESQIELLKMFDQKYDFYITNQIKKANYSKEWKLYYPEGF